MSKILKISAIIILLVAITYIIVATFFSGDSNTNTQFSRFGNMVAPGAGTTTKSTDDLEVNMDKILINLHSGSYKYMKVDMALKMKNKKEKNKLINSMPQIRDTILRFSSNQDSNNLATSEGKQQYKADLIDLIYESYGFQIEDIYFRDFVLAK